MYVCYTHLPGSGTQRKNELIFQLQTLQMHPGSWLSVPSPWPVGPRARVKVAGRR